MTRFRRTTKDGTETADALALDSHDKKKRFMDFAVESAKAKYELEMKVSAFESENQKNMLQTETVNTHQGTVFDQIIENLLPEFRELPDRIPEYMSVFVRYAQDPAGGSQF